MPVFFRRKSYYSVTVTTATDMYIKIKAKALILTSSFQPCSKGSFTFTFGPDEDSPSPRECSPPRHLSAESRKSTHDAATVLLLQITATPQPGYLECTVNVGCSVQTFLDDEDLLFFEIV